VKKDIAAHINKHDSAKILKEKSKSVSTPTTKSNIKSKTKSVNEKSLTKKSVKDKPKGDKPKRVGGVSRTVQRGRGAACSSVECVHEPITTIHEPVTNHEKLSKMMFHISL
jgi:hypothetical protein